MLEWQVILQLLLEEEFYTDVPEYLFMREMGLAAARQVLQPSAEEKAKCRGCDQKKIAAPAVATFSRHTLDLHDHSWRRFEDGRLLENLVQAISAHLGYRPTPIVLYYRTAGGGTDRLEF